MSDKGKLILYGFVLSIVSLGLYILVSILIRFDDSDFLKDSIFGIAVIGLIGFIMGVAALMKFNGKETRKEKIMVIISLSVGGGWCMLILLALFSNILNYFFRQVVNVEMK